MGALEVGNVEHLSVDAHGADAAHGVERRHDAARQVHVLGGRREGLKSSYAKLEDRDDPLLEAIGDTDLIPNEGALVEVKAGSGQAVPLTLIPPVIAHSGATISIPDTTSKAPNRVGSEVSVPVAGRAVTVSVCFTPRLLLVP